MFWILVVLSLLVWVLKRELLHQPKGVRRVLGDQFFVLIESEVVTIDVLEAPHVLNQDRGEELAPP